MRRLWWIAPLLIVLIALVIGPPSRAQGNAKTAPVALDASEVTTYSQPGPYNAPVMGPIASDATVRVPLPGDSFAFLPPDTKITVTVLLKADRQTVVADKGCSAPPESVQGDVQMELIGADGDVALKTPVLHPVAWTRYHETFTTDKYDRYTVGIVLRRQFRLADSEVNHNGKCVAATVPISATGVMSSQGIRVRVDPGKPKLLPGQ